MKEKLFSKEIAKKLITVLLCLVIALLSIFVVSKYATNPETYKNTIQSIDEKKVTVAGITATAAATATTLALIPEDATTPIANKILDISSYLLIVVCILVLEKSLLTVFGYLSFNILIPIAFCLFGVYNFIKKETLKILGIKFIVFALVIVNIVPFTMKISDMIYETNKTYVEQITEDSNNLDDETENKNWLQKAISAVKETVSEIKEKAKEILNKFIDVVALFIIAYCVLPIIIVLVVFWFIKLLFGITIPLPKKENLQVLNKFKKNTNKQQSEEISDYVKE